MLDKTILTEFETFLDFSVTLSKLLARVTDERPQIYEPAILELVTLLPASTITTTKIRDFLRSEELEKQTEAGDLPLILRTAVLLNAITSDIIEARMVLINRGILPPG